MKDYDVIVVGAGHAGAEAATAVSRMNCCCLLLTMNVDQIGTMSCNPAIGGLGKSQMAKEVDALGGLMARAADSTAMQYRVLNERKGPAVQATRVQVDRHKYRQQMKWRIENQRNIDLKQAQVSKLLLDRGKITGIETSIGQKFYSRAIIITTGTFMNGKAHVGKQNFASGRAGEPPSIGLSDFLKSIGMRIGRFKTGTVPRLDAKSIDYSKLEEQKSQDDCIPLSLFTEKLRKDLCSAYLAFTNERTHEIIHNSLDLSPLYSGIIESRGPRYCPSVEDKIVRFADKNRHQVFLEREGRWTNEVYAGGLSTSLPYDCQIEFLRSIPGLEKVEIIRPGYAIEYDYIDSTQLFPNLEVKEIQGLFFAGQVNGTSGYEEAAAQGLMAGVNAALKVKEQEPFILQRNEAYLAVLIDDLVTKGTKEPYRMLSSRAEWRLMLREDNVDSRLLRHSERLGLLSEEDLEKLHRRIEEKDKLLQQSEKIRIRPDEKINFRLEKQHQLPVRNAMSLREFIKRPKVSPQLIRDVFPEFYLESSRENWKKVFSEIKYEGYIKQSLSQLKKIERLERTRLPLNMNYKNIHGLPYEAIEKLSEVRPITLGQAGRISGISPASLSVLAIYLSRRKNNNDACVSELGSD